MEVQKTVEELMNETRDFANDVTIRHKKKSSFRLYEALAKCLEICERCLADPKDRKEVERLFREQPKGELNRRYVEKGSDEFQLVCRYVFAGSYLTNATRYAQALRVARDNLQISSGELYNHLCTEGGVNALYFRRKLDNRIINTKALRLAEQISFSRDAELKLTLRWQNDNSFEVVECEIGE